MNTIKDFTFIWIFYIYILLLCFYHFLYFLLIILILLPREHVRFTCKSHIEQAMHFYLSKQKHSVRDRPPIRVFAIIVSCINKFDYHYNLYQLSTIIYHLRVQGENLTSPNTLIPQKVENIFLRTRPTQLLFRPFKKKLIITKEHIEILRKFIQNHYSKSEISKFETDDDFKKMIFLRISPLVHIQRCPLIDRMLRRSIDTQMTSADFALNLGLRSITETSMHKLKKYKI